MKNVTTRIEKSKLIIEVDLKKRFGKSGSGKNEIIATTSGNTDVGDGVKMGLNVYIAAGAPKTDSKPKKSKAAKEEDEEGEEE